VSERGGRQPSGNDAAKRGHELRGRAFFLAGHGLAGTVLLGFVVVVAAVIVTGETWRSWIYVDTTPVADTCMLSGWYGAKGEAPPAVAATGERLRVPHRGTTLKLRGTPSRSFNLLYSCKMPEVPAVDDLLFAHLGWIAGDDVVVAADGRVVLSFSGSRKVALPVRGGETVEVRIHHDTARADGAGFVGVQAPVLAKGVAANDRLFTVDLIVNQIRSLGYLIPVLSLGLVLALAWFGGLRSRVITMGLYVLVCVSAQRLLGVVTHFGGIDALVSAGLQSVARFLFLIAVILFHMEAARVRPKLIYPLTRLSGLLGLGAGAWLVVDPSPRLLSELFAASHLLAGVVSLALAYFAYARKTGIGRLVAVISIVTGASYLAVPLTSASGMMYPMGLQIVLPMYVALFLQMQLTRSDSLYWSERQQTQKLTEIVDLETARVATLARFLPKTLVDRFTRRDSIDANLMRVLTPRVENVAVFQADLRGFSRIAAGRSEAELIRIMQACFGPVVDEAQRFAMVKVIGDCLWAFVEPGADGADAAHPVTRALGIASHLGHCVAEVNKQIGTPDLPCPIRFGMAITYGQAVVGNLSSDSCIDYTALGTAVNLAARLEELTKSEEIARTIGPEGVLLSVEAVRALPRALASRVGVIQLKDRRVRSFEALTEVSYLRAEDLAGGAPATVPPELPETLAAA
jgi:class 3 adenylate cyclase